VNPALLRFCLTTVAALAPEAAAALPAIWERYPDLICRYEEAQFCDLSLSKCNPETGKAVIEFDFTRNVAMSFGKSKSDQIAARIHLDAGGDQLQNGVVAGGNMYSFVKVEKATVPQEVDTVHGFAQGVAYDSAFTAHMICHPGGPGR
jgi:hypothetical protein